MASNQKTIKPLLPNSFYKYGNETILSVEKDSRNETYKIKLATPEHYVVSKEFVRTNGMYANAPDNVIEVGMMNFSDTFIGAEMSIYDTMTYFIDRVFDENAFGPYTENGIWLSMDIPSYIEIENILNECGYRVRWYTEENPLFDIVKKLIYRLPSKENAIQEGKDCLEELKKNGISAIFIGEDPLVEKYLRNIKIDGISYFKSKIKNGEFSSFEYLNS